VEYLELDYWLEPFGQDTVHLSMLIGLFYFIYLFVFILSLFYFIFIFVLVSGQRAVVFNKITGVKNHVYPEGAFFRIPLIEQAIIFDVR
jgi:hypothetical protein